MRLTRGYRVVALAVAAAAGIGARVAAQSQYTWAGTTANAWLSGSNWAEGLPTNRFPGTTAGSGGNDPLDEAYFKATLPNSLAVGINMSSGSGGANQLLQLGGISFANTSNDLVIGNSSTNLTGTLQLNGANLPVPTIGAGNIILANVSTGSRTLTIQNTANLGTQSMDLRLGADSRIFVNSNSTIAISTVISDGGLGRGITTYGAGTVVLSGSNTYGGSTVVEEGTLRVTNASGSATGNGAVTVASGAKLAGSGKIVPNTGTPVNDTVTVNGTVQPGTDTSTAHLTIGDSVPASVSVNGTYRWTFSSSGNSSSTAGGSDTNDPNNQSRLVVNGNLAFAPPTIDIVALNAPSFDNTQPYSWRIATAGTVTVGAQPTFNVVGLNTGSGSFQLSNGIGSVLLTFNPVPEPATIHLICGGAACAYRAFRRRRDRRAGEIQRESIVLTRRD